MIPLPCSPTLLARTRRLAFAALFLGSALPAWAGAAETSSLPPERSEGAISYLSGGIGLDESSAIKAAAPKYSLELLFAARDGGNYLAGVQVVIRKGSGETLLDTTAEGPFLLARIPPGRYRIAATHEGQTQERTVSIAARKHRRLVFTW